MEHSREYAIDRHSARDRKRNVVPFGVLGDNVYETVFNYRFRLIFGTFLENIDRSVTRNFAVVGNRQRKFVYAYLFKEIGRIVAFGIYDLTVIFSRDFEFAR